LHINYTKLTKLVHNLILDIIFVCRYFKSITP